MSKAARKRAKRRISMPGGETAPMQKSAGRPPTQDPRIVALAARKHHCGGDDPNNPALEHDLGRCIIAVTKGDEQEQLLRIWSNLIASWNRYCLFYLGQTGNAKGSTMAMIPEPMETDQSLRVDLRSHDEKVHAAKTSWAGWEARINALPAPQFKWALRGAYRGSLGEGALWRDRQPTGSGRTAVMALQRLGLDGN